MNEMVAVSTNNGSTFLDSDIDDGCDVVEGDSHDHERDYVRIEVQGVTWESGTIENHRSQEKTEKGASGTAEKDLRGIKIMTEESHKRSGEHDEKDGSLGMLR
jgi:hypothetical protein